MIFGGVAYLVALIPGVGVASIKFAIAAIILGIIGLVLGSVLLLLVLAAFAAFY